MNSIIMVSSLQKEAILNEDLYSPTSSCVNRIIMIIMLQVIDKVLREFLNSYANPR